MWQLMYILYVLPFLCSKNSIHYLFCCSYSHFCNNNCIINSYNFTGYVHQQLLSMNNMKYLITSLFNLASSLHFLTLMNSPIHTPSHNFSIVTQKHISHQKLYSPLLITMATFYEKAGRIFQIVCWHCLGHGFFLKEWLLYEISYQKMGVSPYMLTRLLL